MKEIKKIGEIKSQAGLPYNPTTTEKNLKGESYTFTHSKEDIKYKKYFEDEEQWETFISLPLTEAQRNTLMSKLQGKYAKKLAKEKEEVTLKKVVEEVDETSNIWQETSYADVVKKNLT